MTDQDTTKGGEALVNITAPERPGTLARRPSFFSTDPLAKLRVLRKSIEQIEEILETRLGAIEQKMVSRQPMELEKDRVQSTITQIEQALRTDRVVLEEARADAQDYASRAAQVRRAITDIDDEIAQRLNAFREQITRELEEARDHVKTANEAYEAARNEFNEVRKVYLDKKKTLKANRRQVQEARDQFQATKERLTEQVEKGGKDLIRDLARRKQTLTRDAENIEGILAVKDGEVAGKAFRVSELEGMCEHARERLEAIARTEVELEAEASQEAVLFEKELRDILEPSGASGLASALLFDLGPRPEAAQLPAGGAGPADFMALEGKRPDATEDAEISMEMESEVVISPVSEFQLDLDDLEIVAGMVTPIPRIIKSKPLKKPEPVGPPPIPQTVGWGVTQKHGRGDEPKPSEHSASPEGPPSLGGGVASVEVSFDGDTRADTSDYDIIDERPHPSAEPPMDDEEHYEPRPSQQPTPIPLSGAASELVASGPGQDRGDVRLFTRTDDANDGELSGVRFSFVLAAEGQADGAAGSLFLVDGHAIIDLFGQAAQILSGVASQTGDAETTRLRWKALLETDGKAHDLTVTAAIEMVRRLTLEIASRCHAQAARYLEQKVSIAAAPATAEPAVLDVALEPKDVLVLTPRAATAMTARDAGILECLLDDECVAELHSKATSSGALAFRDEWDVKSLASRVDALLTSGFDWAGEHDRCQQELQQMLVARQRHE
jgi:hypothetical protein